MLDIAQEPVGGRSVRPPFSHRSSWPVPVRASIGSVARSRSSGIRPPAISCCVWTKNSISRMPPRPSLMLWPFDGDLAMALVGMDLPLDRVDVRNRRIVEIFAEHERRRVRAGTLAGLEIAGNGARLDECRPLPVLPPALVIEHRRLDRRWPAASRRDRAADAGRCERHSRRRCAPAGCGPAAAAAGQMFPARPGDR